MEPVPDIPRHRHQPAHHHAGTADHRDGAGYLVQQCRDLALLLLDGLEALEDAVLALVHERDTLLGGQAVARADLAELVVAVVAVATAAVIVILARHHPPPRMAATAGMTPVIPVIPN